MTDAIKTDETNHLYWRKDFPTDSAGTEEELSGPCLIVPPGTPDRIAIVRNRLTGDVLVEITTDMPHKSKPGFTIELKTTPTTLTDTDGWLHRRRAVQTAIWYLQTHTAYPFDPTKPDDYKIYRTEILCPGVRCDLNGYTAITNADRQVNIGVRADLIGVNRTLAELQEGKLHPNVTLDWYRHAFTQDAAVRQLTPREQICYAFVLSSALKLCRIIDLSDTELLSGTRTINYVSGDAKNKWRTRPSTPPIRLLDTLPELEKLKTLHAIASAPLPALDATALGKTGQQLWTYALGKVIGGGNLGGHMPPTATVDNHTAMLFEYRMAGRELYPDTCWSYTEFPNGKNFPEMPSDHQ